jgi:hypothetical protein
MQVFSICLKLLEGIKCSTFGLEQIHSPEVTVVINPGTPIFVTTLSLDRDRMQITVDKLQCSRGMIASGDKWICMHLPS